MCAPPLPPRILPCTLHISILQAHHGQCPRCSQKIARADAEIANALAGLGPTDSVGAALPACPNASCKGAKVLFNGCVACGHLFANTSWGEVHTYFFVKEK